MQFTIGSLISVVAFLLAFSQFLRPIIHLRINTGWLKFKHAKWLFFIGAIMVFIAAIIGHLPVIIHKPYVWSFGKALFWEFSAGIIIFTAAIILLQRSFSPAKYSQKNSKIFLGECYQIIANGIEKDLNELANEMQYSMEKIFNAALKHIKSPENPFKNLEYSSPIYLLDLFSDQSFCKSIVCSNPKTLHATILAAKNISDERVGSRFIAQLLLSLLTEHQSILYREEKNKGLGLFYGIKIEIFEDFNFLIGSYQPLSIWKFSDKDSVGAIEIKKYFELVNSALATYMDKNEDTKPQIFFSALTNIAEIITNNNYRTNMLSENRTYDSPQQKNLLACFLGVSNLITTIAKHSTNFQVEEKSIKKSKFDFLHEDRTLYGALAYGIYKIIEQFSTKEYNNDSIKLLVYF